MARRISSPILIGREAEVRAFEAAFQDASDGRPSILVLGGEAGVGKSRLLAEFAASTRARGGLVALGTTPPPAGPERVPLAALVQALRMLVRSIDARLLAAALGSTRGDLAALLPELGTPTPAAAPDAYATARLAEAVLVAIESVAARQPPLLFGLEDVHWMDDATRATVLYLCRTLVDAPVMLVLTYRSDHAPEAGGLLDMLAEIGRNMNVDLLEVGPLDPADVAVQVRSITGMDLPDERVREIVHRSGGNPFFVEELLIVSAGAGPTQTPASVRMSVQSRLATLSRAASAIVEATALAGRAVSVGLLREVTGLAGADLSDGIEEARASQLIVTRDDQDGRDDGRLDARHVLIAEAVVEIMSALRRRDHHRRYAAALARQPGLGGPSRIEQASMLARHRLLAGEELEALPALLAEAAAAEEAHAFDSAARAYRIALDIWTAAEHRGPLPAHPMLPDRAIVLERAAHACSLAGQAEAAIVMIQAAIASVPGPTGAADPERPARLTMHLARFEAETGRAEALATARMAVAAAPAGSLLRARGLVLVARMELDRGEHRSAFEAAQEAAELAARLGARSEMVQARTALAVALSAMGRPTEALEAVGSADALAGRRPSALTVPTRPSRLVGDLLGFLDRALVLEQAGRPADAARAAQAGMHAARARGLGATQGAMLGAVAARDLLRTGAWDEALEVLGEAGTEGPPEASLVRAQLAARRGAWSAAETALASVRAPSVGLERGWAAYPALVMAEMAWWRRRFREAAEAVAVGSDAEPAPDETETIMSLALLELRIRTDARWARGRRRGAPAAPLGAIERRSVALEVASRRPGAAAPTPRQEAILATATAERGRWRRARALEISDDAPALAALTDAWEAAATAWDGAGDPFEAACCRWRSAETLAEARDRDGARTVLRAVMAAAERLGAAPLAREAESLARRARLVDLGPPGRSSTAASIGRGGQARARELGLSDRETEVLVLIAEGLTDREIGERLFITPKTVGHHVSHILAKLVLDRRGEAAALAFRIGLVERPV